MTATFPEGARALGLDGAEIVFNPSATVAGFRSICGSWNNLLTQPPMAISSAPLTESEPKPHGTSVNFTAPAISATLAVKIIAQASRDQEELLVADLNLEEIEEVRNTWQFYRDRRPETYESLVKL